jgi:Ser/Thr protein kinase RdoA (MazF antagonist)
MIAYLIICTLIYYQPKNNYLQIFVRDAFMKPYDELTHLGRLHRLHNLATLALENYDLNLPQPRYFGWYTNLLFRVTTASGELFMLRLASPGWRTYDDLCSEAVWLEALARDTQIPVPRILPTHSGEYVQAMCIPGSPRVWNVSLMRWVPGRSLKHYLNQPNLEKMGALFAALHLHGKSWTPPAGFTTRRFEHWLSRGEPNLLIQEHASPTLEGLPGEWRGLLERLHQHVEQAYAQADRSDLRIIHCDLWHENIKLHHGVLYPLDFEDTTWGFRSHDIAMAMLDLLEATDESRYANLLAAFQRGYTAHLPWPVEPIEPFQVGRLLWKINWFARFRPEKLLAVVESHVPVFEHYLRRGKVIQPPALVF